MHYVLSTAHYAQHVQCTTCYLLCTTCYVLRTTCYILNTKYCYFWSFASTNITVYCEYCHQGKKRVSCANSHKQCRRWLRRRRQRRRRGRQRQWRRGNGGAATTTIRQNKTCLMYQFPQKMPAAAEATAAAAAAAARPRPLHRQQPRG